MDDVRKKYQGLRHIVRFNWHYYILSLVCVAFILLFEHDMDSTVRMASNIVIILTVCFTFISLVVSSYIYDFSDLYKLSWLTNLTHNDARVVNVNAGFDETSTLLKRRYNNSELLVFDFYNPERHTEISIKRARKAYPAFPGTQRVNTAHLPIQNNSADKIFAILSAHEIRNDKERIVFFREMGRVLKASGEVIVTEHLRDTANFLAYNIGFLHFHSRPTWLKTFHASGFSIAKEIKITPFITTFILKKDGAAY